MSTSDLKHQLRKYEFPLCAREALLRIEQLLSGRGAPSAKQLDTVMDLISEFVFCEAERRGARRGPGAGPAAGLGPLQELQLIDIICDFLSGNITEVMKNTIFLSLFGGMENPKRLKILSILASMAVSASNTPILLAVGVWLQQTGCSSPQSLELVENVIRDHFHLTSSNQPALKSLAVSVPQFVANFMTTVTELYMNGGNNQKMIPRNLLEVITSWVCSSPSLCAAAQLSPPALPPGAIPMPGGTALPGLLRCTVIAPLLTDPDEQMEEPLPKKIKLEEERAARAAERPSEARLLARLHLGVLLGARRAGAGAAAALGPALGPAHGALLALLPLLRTQLDDLRRAGADPATDPRIQECLDRVGQAAATALGGAEGASGGAAGGLLAALRTLPPNRLLRIVLDQHRAS